MRQRRYEVGDLKDRFVHPVVDGNQGGAYSAISATASILTPLLSVSRMSLPARRLPAHNRLHDAVHHWARIAVQRDPIC